jgi:hypothetical protein
MNIPSEERKKLFKQAMDESYALWRNKDYENAFRAVAMANQYIPDFDDSFEYLEALIKMSERQASIIASERKPDYSMYLLYSLEPFAFDIARSLLSFPHLSNFFYWKETQRSPFHDDGSENPEVDPDRDDDDIKALKALKIFPYRQKFYKEYLDFVYNDLPVIYGIPDKYTHEYLKSLHPRKTPADWNQMLFTVAKNLGGREVCYLGLEIYNFISNLTSVRLRIP